VKTSVGFVEHFGRADLKEDNYTSLRGDYYFEAKMLADNNLKASILDCLIFHFSVLGR